MEDRVLASQCVSLRGQSIVRDGAKALHFHLGTQEALADTLGILTDRIRSGELGVGELLHGIAEKTRSVTGATGVALALRREDDRAVVCRARSGETAPGLGTPLNSQSGISGECLRTGRFLVCSDTETDPRVDAEVCRRLGVRSIVVVPLDDGQETVGILEAFSDHLGAFSDQHVESLEMLAHLAKAAIAPSALPAVPPAWRPGAVSQAVATSPGNDRSSVTLQSFLPSPVGRKEEKKARTGKRLPWPIPASLIAIVALSVSAVAVFGWMLERRANANVRAVSAQRTEPIQGSRQSDTDIDAATALTVYTAPADGLSRRRDAAPLVQASEKSTLLDSGDTEMHVTNIQPTVALRRERASADEEPAPPTVLAAGKPQVDVLNSVLEGSPSIPKMGIPVSQGATPAKLKKRVAPTYPAQAREMRVEGPVVLRALIGEDGAVREVEVVEGNPLLTRAAVDAVRQWRYEPYQLDRKPVAANTDITVVFKLNP